MTQARTFTREAIFLAAEIAAAERCNVRLCADGEMQIQPSGNKPAKAFRTIPFPDRVDGTSYVYFLQNGPFVKIGVAVDIRRRHKDIQGNNPIPVNLIHYVQGTITDEVAMHARFELQWHAREWFTLKGELLEYLEEVTANDTLQ